MMITFEMPDEKTLATKDGIYSLFRVKDFNRWADGHKLQCPPAVYPGFERPLKSASTTRTPMSKYGWEGCLRTLNPGRLFYVAVQKGLVMFNGQDSWDEGNDKMETLFFACAWVFAKPSDVWGWHEIFTMNWESGPPSSIISYKRNPALVQKFTMMCWREGVLLARQLYYPVVSRYKCYLPSEWLEPWSPSMTTPDPPYGSTLMVDDKLQEIIDYKREHYDYRDWQ